MEAVAKETALGKKQAILSQLDRRFCGRGKVLDEGQGWDPGWPEYR